MKPNLRLIAAWMALAALAVCGAHAQTSAVVNRDRVNVRGQASMTSEVITQLQKNETVVVIEEMPSAKAKPAEPASWVRIRMPSNTPVWVHAPFIDSTNKTVKVSRLNVRGGPAEGFSVVARLAKGDQVREIRTVGDWMEIEAPAEATAFVAAEFLDMPAKPAAAQAQETPPPPVLAESPTPVTPVPVSAPPPSQAVSTPPAIPAAKPAVVIEAKPAEKAVVVLEEAKPAEKAVVITPEPAAKTEPPVAAPAPKEPESPEASEAPSAPTPSKRIVRRQGVVRSTLSIQAPTYFELVSRETGKLVNYLHATSPEQKVKSLRGKRVIVVGEEIIEPRWPKTPVIEIETIELAP